VNAIENEIPILDSTVFRLVSQRGTTRIMESPLEILPYAVVTQGCEGYMIIARTADHLTAEWVLDGLEGEESPDEPVDTTF